MQLFFHLLFVVKVRNNSLIRGVCKLWTCLSPIWSCRKLYSWKSSLCAFLNTFFSIRFQVAHDIVREAFFFYSPLLGKAKGQFKGTVISLTCCWPLPCSMDFFLLRTNGFLEIFRLVPMMESESNPRAKISLYACKGYTKLNRQLSSRFRLVVVFIANSFTVDTRRWTPLVLDLMDTISK